MNFTEKDRLWSISLMNHLYRWRLTQFFRGSNDIISYVFHDRGNTSGLIYLDLVRDKLFDSKYANMDSFMYDLKKIWTDVKEYCKDNALYYVYDVIATEILTWIKNQEKYRDKTLEEIWFSKLLRKMNVLNDHIKEMPAGFSPVLLPPKQK